MQISFSHVGRSADDYDITLHLDHHEMHALGADVRSLLDWFNTTLTSLVTLRHYNERSRTGATPASYARAVNDLDTHLIPRLTGIRDAAIRAHHSAGGSVGNLAEAMNTARSTAQYRRDVLLASEPSSWEQWATGYPDPTVNPPTEEA